MTETRAPWGDPFLHGGKLRPVQASPRNPAREDRDAGVDRVLRQVPVSGDQYAGPSCDRFGQDFDVVGVAHLDFEVVGRHCHHCGLAPEEGNDFSGDIPGQTDLARQDPLQLAQYQLASDEPMPGKDDGEHVSAAATSGEGTDEDVGVEEDPQEMF